MKLTAQVVVSLVYPTHDAEFDSAERMDSASQKVSENAAHGEHVVQQVAARCSTIRVQVRKQFRSEPIFCSPHFSHGSGSIRIDRLAESKIRYFQRSIGATAANEDVGRFNVSMNELLLVDVVQCTGHLIQSQWIGGHWTLVLSYTEIFDC